MKYNELEKHIQQQLNDQEVPMNTDLLIADLFGNNQRKNPLFFWLAGFTAVLMAALTFYMWKIKTQENRDVKHKTEIEKIKATSLQNSHDQNETTVALASINVPNNEAQSAELNSTTQVNKESNISNTNNSSVQKNKLTPNAITNRAAGKTSEAKNNELINRVSVIQKSDKTSKENNITKNPDESQVDRINNSSKEEKSDLTKLEPAKIAVTSDFSAENDNQLLPGVKCPTFKQKKQWVFSVIPEVGYFYPLTTFQYNNNAEVLDLRKNNESTLEGLQAALYGKISHKRRPWYVKSGVNYGRIARKMDLNQSYTRSDTTIGIISITESQNGDTITVVRGPIVTETNITRREVRHYYHHLWSIPLTLGFQQHNDYFEWGVEAGVCFNLSSNQSGYVMTTADDFGAVSSAGLYKKKLGLSYLAQAHVGLPFSERSVLAMAIRANINPNNYATNASFIDEKYQMLGVHLMYEFRF